VSHKVELNEFSPEQGALFLLLRAGLIASTDVLEQVHKVDIALAKALSEEMGGLSSSRFGSSLSATEPI
jgi:hypothetical protein